MNIPDFIPVLSRSSHYDPAQGACVMEMVSFLAGEEWSDHPKCVNAVLNTLAISVNDWVSDDNRKHIAKLIPDFIGSAVIDTLALKARIQQEVLPDYYNYIPKADFQYMATCNPHSFQVTAVVSRIDEALRNSKVITMTNQEWDMEMIGYLEKVMAIVREMKGTLTTPWKAEEDKALLAKTAEHVSQKANA